MLKTAATTVEREELGTERPAESSEIKVFILSLLLWNPCLCPFRIHVLKPKPSVMVLGSGPWGGDEIMGVEPPSGIRVLTKETSRSFHHERTLQEDAVYEPGSGPHWTMNLGLGLLVSRLKNDVCCLQVLSL